MTAETPPAQNQDDRLPPTPGFTPPPEGLVTEPEGAGVTPIDGDESAPVLLGVRRWLNARSLDRVVERAAKLDGDDQFNKHAAEASRAKRDPLPAYDPLTNFDTAHRSKRAPYGERPQPVDESPRARTSLQEQAALRANLRVDALNKRDQIVADLISLYGEILYDEEALAQELATGRYSRGERKAMRAASKRVRNAQASSERLEGRLDRSATGTDVKGIVTGVRLDSAIDRGEGLLEQKRILDELEKQKQRAREAGSTPRAGVHFSRGAHFKS